jgi:hypothetical protein
MFYNALRILKSTRVDAIQYSVSRKKFECAGSNFRNSKGATDTGVDTSAPYCACLKTPSSSPSRRLANQPIASNVPNRFHRG